MVELLVYALIVMNFVAFAAFGIDKMLAESGSWRISEATLLSLALFGGMPGALAGRQAFRHKTRKKSFRDGLVAVGVVQLAIVGLLVVLIRGGDVFPFGTLFESAEEREARIAVEQSVTYSGCRAVRAAGKAPLYRGQPGYSRDMDGDGDGVACEPYR